MPINGLGRDLLALLMPIECLGCKTESDWICPSCRRALTLQNENLCFCGKSGENGLCTKHQRELGLDGLTTLFSYTEPAVKELISQIKYRGHIDGVNFLTRYYQKKVLARLPRGEWVVTAVPLSKERYQTRGFNQSELIAKKLTSPLYDYSELLIKRRETKPQAKLNKRLREKNLLRSFAITKGQDIPSQIILVDDVLTTGSTLKETAGVLRKNGAQRVWGLTIAHG
jgi:ComF family protein